MDASAGAGRLGAARTALDERRDAELKTCPKCGGANGDGAASCQWCGATLPAPQAPDVTAEAAAGTSDGATAAPLLPPPPTTERALQYTRSGTRYLLGYSATKFGIWDRERPGSPVEAFPRTDDGWRAAWERYSVLEPDSAEVGLATGASASAPQAGTASWGGAGYGPTWPTRPRRTVSGWWWLLPILMGWLGGLIAWLANRDTDSDKARQMLLVGIAISVLGFLLLVPGLSSLSSP